MTNARDLQIITDPVRIYPCVSCGSKLDLDGREAFSPVRCPACRAEMQVPARMGGFVLVELLGAGGMGSAYRARDEALNRDVAIKIMLKSFGDDPKFVETFRREAQAAARLNHPNVVQIYSFGEFKGQPFIVMELVTGGSLDRQMSSGEPLDPPVVMRIGLEIASALQSGYQVQLIHGDIKPENILLDEKGAAKLVDFGIAQLAGCQSQEVWGTPYYIAPEKVRRQRADCRADIYSLGGTLYHALAGKAPFDGEDATAVVKARFLEPAQPLGEIRADLDPEIDTIIGRMLQLEPSMRYPTYESLLGDLRQFLDRAGPGTLAIKKLVLRKRGGTSTTNVPMTGKMAAVTAPATSSPATATSAKGTPKLVIKKAGPSLSLSPAKGGGQNYAGSKVPAGGVAPGTTGISVGVVVLLVVLCLVLAAGIGAGVWFLAKRNPLVPVGGAVTPPVVAGAPGTKELDAVKQQLQGCLALAHTARTNLQAWAAAGERLCSAANAAVTNLLGADQYEIMIPLRPPPPLREKLVAVTAGAPVATNGVAAQSEHGTNLAATAVASGTNAANMVGAAPAVDPVQESSVKDPVIVNVRNMYRGLYRLDELAAESAGLQDALDAAVAGVSATVSVESLSVQAMAFEGQVQPYTATGSKTDEARRKLANLQQDLLVVSNLVKEIQKIRIQNDLAAAAVAEQKRLEAERSAKETARMLKVADEIAKITSRESEIKELLRKHRYADARRKLGTVEMLLSEEESRKAFELATQRINRLEALQEFFIEQLTGFTLPAGKIESASKSGLSVRVQGALKEVPWDDKSMVRFMRQVLMSEEGSRKLKLRQHVQALINASLYCRVFILPEKHVQELVEKMVEKALILLPDCRSEVEQFLPDFVKPEGEKPAASKSGE